MPCAGRASGNDANRRSIIMNVLVCGGAGYIGSHTVRRLRAAGYTPVIFDNFATGHEYAVERVLCGPDSDKGGNKDGGTETGGSVIRGDLLDPASLDAAFASRRFDAVIHLAGLILVGESVVNPGPYYENNVTGTLNLLRAMAGAGVNTLVFSSTCAVFGEPETMPLTEDLPMRPVSPYGNTKLAAEMMMHDFAVAHGMRCVALRYFNAAGADEAGDIGEDHNPESHLIPLAIQAVLGQGPALRVFGNDYATPDGTCLRDYVHVNDLADAHIAALRHCAASDRSHGRSRGRSRGGSNDGVSGGGLFEGFNLGTGRATSVLEILSGVEAVSGKKVPYSFAPRRPGDSPELCADPSKARDVLGWQARHTDVNEIIASAWRWHAGK